MTLTREQILAIPEMVKTKTIPQVAAEYKCHERTVNGAIRKLRSEGIKVPTHRGRRPIKLK